MDRHRRALSTIAAAPAIVFTAVFFVLPLAAILRRGLAPDGTLELPTAVLTDGTTWSIAWFTIWQAGVSTLLTLAGGLPLAWALSRFAFRGRRALEALVLVPFVLPTLVVATAFGELLPATLDHTIWAILAAHVFFNLAVVVRVVGAYWAGVDRRLADAAATLGAGPLARFRTVTLPVLAPAISAAAVIVFLFCFTSFGVIVVLGGPRFSTLETEIYNQAVRFFDLRTAAALAVLQLVAVVTTVLAAGRLERRVVVRARPSTPTRLQRRAQRLAVAGIACAALVFLAMPPLLLVRRAFETPQGLGLTNFAALTHETPALLVAPWHAVVNSLLYAGAATVVALAVGIPAAFAIGRGRRLVELVVMLPLGASAAMLGLGFILAFASPPLELRDSRAIVPLAQALVAVPFVVRALTPSLRALDTRLREAAAVLGATPRQVVTTIELPLLARALAIAGGTAFAIALGEFGATVFLARADAPTLPVAIFRFLGRPGAENAGTAAALAVVLMTLVVLVAVLVERGLERRPA
ncbi:MAG: iron ABC transporter permease [Gaiellales bacterium]